MTPKQPRRARRKHDPATVRKLRFVIPVTAAEHALYFAAANSFGVDGAEWARAILNIRARDRVQNQAEPTAPVQAAPKT